MQQLLDTALIFISGMQNASTTRYSFDFLGDIQNTLATKRSFDLANGTQNTPPQAVRHSFKFCKRHTKRICAKTGHQKRKYLYHLPYLRY